MILIRKSQWNIGNTIGLGIAIALMLIVAGLLKLTWPFWTDMLTIVE